MVNVYKKALRRFWAGRCSVFIRKAAVNPDNGRNEPCEVQILEDVPCRLSFSSAPGISETHEAAGVQQTIKLFLTNGVEIPAGSKIRVTQNGRTADYARSGEPACYCAHQEIELALFKRWA